ncbi:MAG: hypothetical protein K8T89_10050 [Planctomycetes bacterium]|nr:hypothetical protein [Planctomycetota bacterium]
MSSPILDREEYIEQAYFFRVFRERLADGVAAQEVLGRIDEEILSTTRLPMAIQFLATDLKHTGLLGDGFARLSHYFTPFQAFVFQQAEKDGQRFSMPTALLILEREAQYKSGTPTKPGLFVYQFEALCRNRLGYLEGITAMAGDPLYDDAWRHYLDMVRRQVGVVEFAELVYLRSELYVKDQRRSQPAYEPPVQPLLGEKEGKIAKASLRRDPLFLFAALQRQLNYPEVPRPKPRDDVNAKLDSMAVKVRELEARYKMLESDLRGTIDLTKLGKPELLDDLE